jgi:hypothetical protein
MGYHYITTKRGFYGAFMGLSVLYLINVPFLSWDGPIFTLRGEPHHRRHASLNIVTFN